MPKPIRDDGPQDSAGERFLARVRAGDEPSAARLLAQEVAGGLRRSLARFRLSLGGADELEAVVNLTLFHALRRWERFDGRDLAGWVARIGERNALDQLRRREQPWTAGELAERERRVNASLEADDAVRSVLAELDPRLERVLVFDLVHGGRASGHLAPAELGVSAAAFHKLRSEARRAFRAVWTRRYGGGIDG